MANRESLLALHGGSNTLRRVLLTSFFLSVSGWSQTAPQQAQSPIVVQVQMPTTPPWMHLIDMILPGIVGAGLALLGVWFTNKANERTNAENRKHQQELERIKDEIAAQARSRDNRWTFRKDVYSGLVKTISTLSLLFQQSFALNQSYLAALKDPPQMQPLVPILQEFLPLFRAAILDFLHFANLSQLATASWLAQQIIEVTPVLNVPFEFNLRSPDYAQRIVPVMNTLNTLLKLVSEAGRKDLWETPEPNRQS